MSYKKFALVPYELYKSYESTRSINQTPCERVPMPLDVAPPLGRTSESLVGSVGKAGISAVQTDTPGAGDSLPEPTLTSDKDLIKQVLSAPVNKVAGADKKKTKNKVGKVRKSKPVKKAKSKEHARLNWLHIF